MLSDHLWLLWALLLPLFAAWMLREADVPKRYRFAAALLIFLLALFVGND